MAFDIAGAKKEGYSDQEILGYLTKNRKFDIAGAKNEGYSDGEIIDYLSKSNPQTETKQSDFKPMGGDGQTPVGGFVDKLKRGVEVAASGFNRGMANTIGSPVDIINTALKLGSMVPGLNVVSQLPGIGDAFKGSDKPFMGGQYIKEDIMPQGVKPEGLGENILDAVGEQFGASSIPFGAITKLGQVPVDKLLKVEALLNTSQGIGSGIAREMFPDNNTADIVGQLISGLGVAGASKAIKGVIDVAKEQASKFTTKGIQKEVQEQIQDVASKAPIYRKNLQEAEELQQDIPGLKFTTGQATRDPNLIKMERSQARKMDSDFAARLEEQKATANKAIADYADRIPQGDISDTAIGLSKKESGALDELQGLINKYQDTPGSQERGKTILSELKEAKTVKRLEIGKLFDELSETNPKLDATDLESTLNKVSQPYYESEDSANIPSGLIGKAKKYLKQNRTNDLVSAIEGKKEIPQIEFNELRGLRTEIGKAITNEKGQPNPKDAKLSRLTEMFGSVEKTIDQLQDTAKYGDIASKYSAAREKYKTEYLPYKQGITADVLRKGSRGETTDIPYSQIPTEFVKSGRKGAKEAAQEFIKNLGGRPNAVKALKDDIAKTFLDNATDADGKLIHKKLVGWIQDHNEMLSEFPELKREFLNIAKTQRKVDEVAKHRLIFEGGMEKAASRLLDSENPAREVGHIKRIINDDQKAYNGLRRAIWDHYLTKTESMRIDNQGNPIINANKLNTFMKKNREVMAMLYTPDEMKIMDKTQRAYSILDSTNKSPLGGGSDTAENLNTAATMAKFVGDMAGFPYNVAFKVGKGISKISKWYSKDQRVKLLEDALINPETAKTFMWMSKGVPEKVIKKRFDTNLQNLLNTSLKQANQENGE